MLGKPGRSSVLSWLGEAPALLCTGLEKQQGLEEKQAFEERYQAVLVWRSVSSTLRWPGGAARFGGETGLGREVPGCASVVKKKSALRLPVWYGTVCGIRVLMTV